MDTTRTTSLSSAFASAVGTSSPTPVVQGPKQLGQEDFLRLLLAQLQNQDPLKPIENEAFIAQLAQFSQLEQSVKQVKLLEQSLSADSLNRQLSMVPLVGRQVKVTGGLVELGAGPARIDYTLAGDAESVQVVILTSSKQTVRTLNVGAKPAGTHQVAWDGKDNTGVQVPPGTYLVEIVATDRQGAHVDTTASSLATVSAVRIDNGNPLLLIGGQAVDPKDVVEFY